MISPFVASNAAGSSVVPIVSKDGYFAGLASPSNETGDAMKGFYIKRGEHHVEIIELSFRDLFRLLIGREIELDHVSIVIRSASAYAAFNLSALRGLPMQTKIDGFAPEARPICVFCNAPWTDDMIQVFDIDAKHGEGSWDSGPEEQEATIDITCSSCKRLIYRKEYRA